MHYSLQTLELYAISEMCNNKLIAENDISDTEYESDSGNSEGEENSEQSKNEKARNIIGKQFQELTPLCSYFHCLATFVICLEHNVSVCFQRRIKKRAKKLYETVKTVFNLTNFDSADPVDVRLLAQVSRHFGLNISVQNSETRKAYPKLTNLDYEIRSTINLVQWPNKSFSIIKDMQTWLGIYDCPGSGCQQSFRTPFNLRRHLTEKRCDFLNWRAENPDADEDEYFLNEDRFRKVKNRFIGGKHIPRKTLIDELSDLGFPIPADCKFQPFCCTWDIESMLPRQDLTDNGANMEYTCQHEPVSVSVVSNIPGFDTCHTFMVFEKATDFAHQWLCYMNTMSDKAYELTKEKHKTLLGHLAEEEDKTREKGNFRNANRLARLRSKIDHHMRHLPCVGFNSARYDLPTMIRKAGMVYWLTEIDEREPRVIKKTTHSYTSLTSAKLRFLDLCMFLSPGNSLRSLLRQCGIEDRFSKLHFPYNFLKSVKDLHYPALPAYEEFFSDIKQTNMLNSDYEEYQKLIDQGYIMEDALKKLELSEKPPTGPQRYEELQKLWKQLGFKELWEYLALYNCFDILPLLRVAEMIRDQFWELINCDCFEFSTISSLAFPYLIRQLAKHADYEANFFVNLNEEAFYMIEKSITGGIAHSFTKCAIKGLTEIEPHRFSANEREKVQSTMVLDLNSLYASTIGKLLSHTLGYYSIRRKEDGFRMLEIMEKNLEAQVWLRYQQKVIYPKKYIHTILTVGGEKLLHLSRGRSHHVDGWCDDDGIAFEFHGCFWHGCEQCYPDRDAVNSVNGHTFADLHKETKDMEELVKKHKDVNKLVVMWECQWKTMIAENSLIAKFVRECKPQLTPPVVEDGDISVEHMLELILDNKLVGFVECDMEVPKTIEKYKQMSRFPPFFVKEYISAATIKDPQQQRYAEKYGKLKAKQQMLLSKMSATDLVIPTELLIFYCKELGLNCTNITRVLQFRGAKVFEDWLDNIITNRKLAKEQQKSILAMTIKLLGNSAFGFGLLRLDQRITSKFVKESDLRKWICKSEFAGFLPAGHPKYPEGVMEVMYHPKSVIQNLPRQFSAEVLGVSKIPLLNFIHQIYPMFFRETAYTLVACDTDSLITAFAGETLEDCCKPEMKLEFQQNRNEFFVPDSGPLKHKLSFEPLLMKVEESGPVAISLCPKCYLIINTETQNTKYATKGWNRSIENFHLCTFSAFFSTLFECDFDEQKCAIVRGIRASLGGCLVTYKQCKNALNKLSPKMIYCQRGTCYHPLEYDDENELFQHVYPFPNCPNDPSAIWEVAQNFIKGQRALEYHFE